MSGTEGTLSQPRTLERGLNFISILVSIQQVRKGHGSPAEGPRPKRMLSLQQGAEAPWPGPRSPVQPAHQASSSVGCGIHKVLFPSTSLPQPTHTNGFKQLLFLPQKSNPPCVPLKANVFTWIPAFLSGCTSASSCLLFPNWSEISGLRERSRSQKPSGTTLCGQKDR